MTKRRDIVRELLSAGFESKGGTKHETFVKGDLVTRVPRHREIDDDLARDIRRQAGLRR